VGGGGEGCPLAFAPGNGVVVVAGEVLVPVFFGPLQELEVVLHFAFYEGFDGDGAVDVVAGEDIYTNTKKIAVSYVGVRDWGGGRGGVVDVLCRILKFWRYAYSVFALNLTRAIGTSSTINPY